MNIKIYIVRQLNLAPINHCVIAMAVNIDDGPQDAPDRIGPEHSEKRSFKEHASHVVKAFTTKEGLVGTYDYGMPWVTSGFHDIDYVC